MSNIDTIMYLLDWHRTTEEQQSGIRMAAEVKCLKAFFQPAGPDYNKSVWENCAHIVCARTDAELTPYIIDMMLWIQDLNWPGAELILNRLMEFEDVSRIVCLLQDMIPALIISNEVSWLMAISELLDSGQIRKQLDENSIQILSEFKMS